MKVKIGPHLNWVGPYQIADAVFGWPDKYADENTWRYKYSYKFGEWLADTWVSDFCQWIQDKRQRSVYVHIDNYDVWNAGHSLSLIALPLLLKLKEHKHGAPHVDDCDVPEYLKSTSAPAKEHDWDTDLLWFDRWEWVLDEIIWAHRQEVTDDPAEAECWQHDVPDACWPYPAQGSGIEKLLGNIKCDDVKLKAVQARKQNGFRLFGKYYQALWD